MMRRSHVAGYRAVCAIVFLLPAFACTEPRRVDRAAAPSPTSPLDARLELSDSLATPGSTVVVAVRFAGPAVASATARLSFDTTGLALQGEQQLNDGATRVMNAQPGVVRFAGVAANGFTDGRVYEFRFTVLRTAALRTMRLTVDEAHTVSRADAAASMIRKP